MKSQTACVQAKEHLHYRALVVCWCPVLLGHIQWMYCWITPIALSRRSVFGGIFAWRLREEAVVKRKIETSKSLAKRSSGNRILTKGCSPASPTSWARTQPGPGPSNLRIKTKNVLAVKIRQLDFSGWIRNAYHLFPKPRFICHKDIKSLRPFRCVSSSGRSSLGRSS